MSSIADLAEDDGPRTRRARTSWEIQEIGALTLLIVSAVVAVTAVAAGVVGGPGDSIGPPGVLIGETLVVATRWAGIDVVFLLVAALGLIWWQTDGWTDALDDTESTDTVEAEIAEAVGHIQRTRALATWVGVALVVTVAAAVGFLVGLALQQEHLPSGLGAQEWVSSGGESLATVVFAAFGLYAVTHIWKLCDAALTVGHDSNINEDAPDL